ncbi:unnamed protein product [Ilex paraguariensis]|uniref:AB hydrolase-1 domain-containing protein n=1 Tax=Ilex paraguariensis TaxID=185542 RepID=A0ABC8UWI6_9AQUA
MAACGIHPKRHDQVPSISNYFEPLMEFMAALPSEEKVVLVGHSMGGVSIAVAMERFPDKIAVAVFLTAVMPGPDFDLLTINQKFNRDLDSYMDCKFTFDQGPDKPPTSLLFGPEFLSTKLYQLSPPEDLSLATLLMRPFSIYDEIELARESIVTKEKFGSVPRVYFVGDQDKVIKEEFQRWMIENNPTDEVIVIRSSDHMVMFSKPKELSSYLQGIVKKYC